MLFKISYLSPSIFSAVQFSKANQGYYSSWFYLDHDEYKYGADSATTDVSEFSGSITAGKHYIYLSGAASYITETVSYTFYPECKIYYIDGTDQDILTTYELQSSYTFYQINHYH